MKIHCYEDTHTFYSLQLWTPGHLQLWTPGHLLHVGLRHVRQCCLELASETLGLARISTAHPGYEFLC
jgi:hypothetical protein